MTFNELKANAKQKWYTTKAKIKTKVHDGYVWCCEHREETALIVTGGVAVLGAIGKTVRSIDRKIDLHKEQNLKDLYVYDRSLGIYHELRRKLRPSEALEIDRRRSEGESMAHILASMRLLK